MIKEFVSFILFFFMVTIVIFGIGMIHDIIIDYYSEDSSQEMNFDVLKTENVTRHYINVSYVQEAKIINRSVECLNETQCMISFGYIFRLGENVEPDSTDTISFVYFIITEEIVTESVFYPNDCTTPDEFNDKYDVIGFECVEWEDITQPNGCGANPERCKLICTKSALICEGTPDECKERYK